MRTANTILVFLCLGLSVSGNTDPEVELTSGKIRGLSETIGHHPVDIFLGIPFAKPPVSELRFKRPEPVEPWDTTLDVQKVPKSCWQVVDTAFDQFPGVDMWNPNTEMSEDCLYLNVWAPETDTPLPVMIWIYGGGLYSGTSTLDLYDGRLLARFGHVVVVSMQYRVGPLGFLYAGTSNAPGNVGLLDQTLALQWVQDNIAAFGGNPDKVTIFGESGGGMSVFSHLLSPISQPLFSNAIIQSMAVLHNTPVQAQNATVQLGDLLNCDSDDLDSIVDCLREASAEEVTNKQWEVKVKSSGWPDLPFVTTVDDYFLLDDPMELLERGEVKKCSTIIGSNTNEGYYFMVYAHPNLFPLGTDRPITKAEFVNVIQDFTSNPLISKLIEFEYGTSYKFTTAQSIDYAARLDEIRGDSAFVCPAQRVARLITATGQQVYNYEYGHLSSKNPWPEQLGVMHGYEIDVVFGHPLNVSLGYTTKEEKFSQTIVRYWTNFAYTG